MKWLIICIIIASPNIKKAEARSCSELESMRLSFEEPHQLHPVTEKHTNNVTRITYKNTAKVRMTRIMWKSVYCPPVELGIFDDCITDEGTMELKEETVKDIKRSEEILVPDACDNGNCDGIEYKRCSTPVATVWASLNYKKVGRLSASWIHHRCSRSIVVESIWLTSHVVIGGDLSVQCEVPGYGHCVTNNNEKSCVINSEWVLDIKEDLEIKKTLSSYLCLTDGDSTLCYDQERRSQFKVEDEKCDRLEGATYCGSPSKRKSLLEEESFIVTMEAVDEITDQLIYENMKSTFQAALLFEQVSELRNILKSLLYYSYNLTTDPLQSFLKIGLTKTSLEGESIVGNVCNPEYLQGSPKRSKGGNSTSINLFKLNNTLPAYEKIKMKFSFIDNPPVLNYHTITSPSSSGWAFQGEGALSILSMMIPEELKFFVKHLMNMLTLLNTLILFYMLKKV